MTQAPVKLNLSEPMLFFLYNSLFGHLAMDIPDTQPEYQEETRKNLLEVQSALVSIIGLPRMKEHREAMMIFFNETTTEEKKQFIIEAFKNLDL